MEQYYAVFLMPCDGSAPVPYKVDLDTPEQAWEAADNSEDFIRESGDLPCVPFLIMGYRTRLELYRRLHCMSQQQLADLTDIPVRTIRAYEQGQRDMSSARGDRLARIAGALNCTFTELLGR